MQQTIELINEVKVGEETDFHKSLAVLSIEQLQSIRNYLIVQEWLKSINQSINQEVLIN